MRQQNGDRKNLRRVSVVISAQTLWHLNKMAAINGWSQKDLGRVIDKLVRMHQIERGYTNDCKR